MLKFSAYFLWVVLWSPCSSTVNTIHDFNSILGYNWIRGSNVPLLFPLYILSELLKKWYVNKLDTVFSGPFVRRCNSKFVQNAALSGNYFVNWINQNILQIYKNRKQYVISERIPVNTSAIIIISETYVCTLRALYQCVLL